MGRSSAALRQVLRSYGISQNKLAVTMGIERTTVYKWFHEERDPSGETIERIVRALIVINPEAARAFIQAFLSDLVDGCDTLEA
jgi:transcriptional regulator with XRE-family HTH domain